MTNRSWSFTLRYLIDRRDELKLSNYQLAKDSAMTESTVHRIMSGQRVPSVVLYFQLLAGLKLNPHLVPKEMDKIKYPKMPKSGKN